MNASPPVSLVRLALLATCLGLAARAGAGELDAKDLYKEFEALNTPENLSRRFVGGQPPEFVKRQADLLKAISVRPVDEAVPILLRLATEHIERAEAVGAPKLLQSPLQAIQVPLIDALAPHAGNDEVRGALARLARSPVIKEYARGRALDALVDAPLSRIAEHEDPRGERRAELLLETLIGALTLPEVLQAPGRIRSLARRAPAVAKGGPMAPWTALGAAADSSAKRYALDAAFAMHIAQKEAAAEPIVPEEKDLLVEAAKRWLQDFRPAAEKAKYPSDLLGEALLRLGARLGHEPLTRLLRDGGVPLPALK